MKIRKILTGLVALALAAVSLSIAAGAVEPSYEVSADYKDTLYYNNLQAIELTGDGATDVIAVALSQLGYHEGNNDAEKDGMNGSGSKNFTEYNVLFGKLDNGEGNGTSYGYAWCAAFVNWCLRQARVDKELTGGMYVSCNSWRNWFLNQGAQYGASYHNRTDDYIPQKGDLIFYKSLNATHSRATDHIGIVLKSEDGKVYAIEGNGDNRVALHEYALTDRYIVGYGTIAYKTAEVPEVDYYRTEDHLPGFFIADRAVIAAYHGPANTTGKVANLTKGAVYRVLAVQGNYGYVCLEEGVYGWAPLKRLTPITTDPYVTVELVVGENSYKTVVAKGASWSIPDTELLTDTLGDLEGLIGWGEYGDPAEPLVAGSVLTPTEDLKLYAMVEIPTETETEALTQTETETEADATTDTDSQATEQSEQTTEAASEGCNGAIGGAVLAIIVVAGAVLMIEKKKR